MLQRVQQPRHGKLNKTFSLPVATIDLLKAESQRTGKPQNQILQEALEAYSPQENAILNEIRRIIREELDR